MSLSSSKGFKEKKRGNGSGGEIGSQIKQQRTSRVAPMMEIALW